MNTLDDNVHISESLVKYDSVYICQPGLCEWSGL